MIFEDLRSPKRIIFSFKGKSTQEIPSEMRLIFESIHHVVNKGRNVMAALKSSQNRERFQRVRNSAFRKVTNLVEKSYEASITALIESMIM